MTKRPPLLLVLAIAVASCGASYQTTNFVVTAPTASLAQQFALQAEKYRVEKAKQWLGYEMPAWGKPCPVEIQVTNGGAGGATSFAFDNGAVLDQHMHIEGPVDRLYVSVLPHEITHTVFAYYFRCPVPRWADEGGAVLSEDDIERDRHDRLCRHILNTPGRAIPLRQLFALKDYPNDVMALYAQGFSVVNYLVQAKGRQTFLLFVRDGMTYGWDRAVASHYGYRDVDELEQAWRAHLRATKRQPMQFARGLTPTGPATEGTFVRQTLPPSQPFPVEPTAVARGQSSSDPYAGTFRDAARQISGRPGYLPDHDPSKAAPPGDHWGPINTNPSPAPTVTLGAIQIAPDPTPTANTPQAQLGRPIPSKASPVGYPYN
jgi:hypothetical protein